MPLGRVTGLVKLEAGLTEFPAATQLNHGDNKSNSDEAESGGKQPHQRRTMIWPVLRTCHEGLKQ